MSKRGDKIIEYLWYAIANESEHDIDIWIDRLRRHVENQRRAISRLTEEKEELQKKVDDLTAELEEMYEYD